MRLSQVSKSLLILPALALLAAAQQSSGSAESRIDAIVSAAMLQHHLPAVSVVVTQNGETVIDKAYGVADLENPVPATTATLFRTASIAKPITAVAVMELVERSKLDLDAPVQKYCPAFPTKQWPITPRELLSHTSGIRHYKGDEPDSTHHYAHTSDAFGIFSNDPLEFEPGTKFGYSTYGYSVLGCVIEGASGQSYPSFIAENVFRQAGMTHTYVDDVFEIVPHRARGYQFKDGRVENAGLMDSSYKIPGGGWVTNPEDLVRFGAALLAGKLLKPETLTLMWTSQKLRDGKETGYGLGFGIVQIAGESAVAHGGGQQGTSTDIIIVPKRKLVAAVMVNMNDVDAADLDRKVVETVIAPKP